MVLVADLCDTELADLARNTFAGLQACPPQIVEFVKENAGTTHDHAFAVYDRTRKCVFVVRAGEGRLSPEPITPVGEPHTPAPAPEDDGLAEMFGRRLDLSGAGAGAGAEFVPQGGAGAGAEIVSRRAAAMRADEENSPQRWVDTEAEEKPEHRSPKGRRSYLAGAEAVPDLYETPQWAVRKILAFLRERQILAPDAVI